MQYSNIESLKTIDILTSEKKEKDPNAKQWLENTGFDSEIEWYSEEEGDLKTGS